ncbi:MAG: Gfo/Idh/MocA family protein, partial [Verrucomicrobiota bacterium]
MPDKHGFGQSPRRVARKIRIGFIGAGAMGFSHLELFHRECRGQAEAVALCASDPGRIARAMEVAPEMRLFQNECDLIHSDLDAVVVSSPNFTHVPLALEALKAGKHL